MRGKTFPGVSPQRRKTRALLPRAPSLAIAPQHDACTQPGDGNSSKSSLVPGGSKLCASSSTQPAAKASRLGLPRDTEAGLLLAAKRCPVSRPNRTCTARGRLLWKLFLRRRETFYERKSTYSTTPDLWSAKPRTAPRPVRAQEYEIDAA